MIKSEVRSPKSEVGQRVACGFRSGLSNFVLRTSAFGLCLSFLLLAACTPYALRGRVIEGYRASVEVVNKNDPRLTTQEPGLADAYVVVTLDPGRLNARRIGSGLSDSTGNFALSVDVSGAGVLMHDVEVVGSRPDFLDASGEFTLPGSNKRVLITLPAGNQKRVDDRPLLERTMEEAQPYLRE